MDSSDDSGAYDFFPSSPSSHRFTSPPPEHIINLKRRSLPLELIECIIQLYHRRYGSFSALRALSETSFLFRMLTLRIYMTSLQIHSARQLASLSEAHISMLARRNTIWERVGLHWVRSLNALSGALAKAPWKPSAMCGLRALRVSFADQAKSTQKMCSKQIFVAPLQKSPMTHLTSLTLTELWRIDALILGMISAAFPGLTSLHLSCSEHLDMSCCWTCFEESTLAAIHSPIPNHFPTVGSLTSAFAKALEPLTKLADLHLGIFLSDEEMLENHIDHYDSPMIFSRLLRTAVEPDPDQVHTGTVLSQSESVGHSECLSYTEDDEGRDSPASAFDEVPPFPHGPELCPICSIVTSAPLVRTRELEASLALARVLKSLKTIGWSSFFTYKVPSEVEGQIGDWRRATKTYIFRGGGRVRVRRRPWY